MPQHIQKNLYLTMLATTVYSGTLRSRNVHRFVISDRKVPQHRVIDIAIPMAISIGHL